MKKEMVRSHKNRKEKKMKIEVVSEKIKKWSLGEKGEG